MPLDLYSYKPGCRSTPKLRRNQSAQKYKNNPSVDSFTSLRPESPGWIQTLPCSPYSPMSDESWPLSPRYRENDRSPAYTRFPAMDKGPDVKPLESVMSPLETVTLSQMQAMEPSSLFTEIGSNPTSPAGATKSNPFADFERPKAESRSKRVSHLEDKCNRSEDIPLAPEAQHVLSLNLLPHQVALFKDANHESAITRIYDYKGNEISYTFGGGVEQFKKDYRRDPPTDEEHSKRKKAPWTRLHSWGKRVREKFNNMGTRGYEVEIWSITSRKRK